MADEEEIAYKFKVEGTAETAAAFDKTTAAMKEQQRVQKMITDTSSDIRRRNEIESLKKQAAEVNANESAFKRFSATVAAANNNQVQFTNQLVKANLQFGQFRSAAGASAALVGNFGQSLAVVAPETTGFVKALQQGGMALSQFLGILGGGPGILLGGAVAGLGLLMSAMASSKREADELAAATAKNTAELNAYLEQISSTRERVGQRLAKAADTRSYEQRFQAGELSSAEYATEGAASRELAAQAEDIRRRMLEANAAGQFDAANKLSAELAKALAAPARGEQARGFEQAARALEESISSGAVAARTIDIERELLEEAAAARAGGGAGRARAGAAGPAGTIGTSDAAAFMMGQAEGGTLAERMQAESDAALKIQQETMQRSIESEQLLFEAKRQFAEDYTFLVEEESQRQLQAVMQRQAAEKAAEQQLAMARMQAVQMGTGAALKGISEVIKGHKLQIGAILEGLGDQFVASGTGLIFQGLGMSAIVPGSGAGAIAVGTAEVAFGLGLGAAGARGPGGSSATSSAGGGGAGRPGGDGGAYSPYRDTFTPSSTAGPVFVNVTMPTVLSPTAEDGLRVQQAIDAGMRVYGR